ncbi:MAG: hypothetical protein CEN89_768 [Candidatus Berkelbacteria bacterium Licking1014_7]|uniref:Uncharacterized protein n=1 Tax=Candidatus Berkelbacteria bacterium Licking1014_7 TaxID=2017147 RepID=A0A554LHG8_9BACT|nr:MAG: hypothetical protein CEN89_768 [Candidatus Berkelbacteria bacterium Licking1014_7]
MAAEHLPEDKKVDLHPKKRLVVETLLAFGLVVSVFAVLCNNSVRTKTAKKERWAKANQEQKRLIAEQDALLQQELKKQRKTQAHIESKGYLPVDFSAAPRKGNTIILKDVGECIALSTSGVISVSFDERKVLIPPFPITPMATQLVMMAPAPLALDGTDPDSGNPHAETDVRMSFVLLAQPTTGKKVIIEVAEGAKPAIRLWVKPKKVARAP